LPEGKLNYVELMCWHCIMPVLYSSRSYATHLTPRICTKHSHNILKNQCCQTSSQRKLIISLLPLLLD